MIRYEGFWAVEINGEELDADELLSISLEESCDMSLPVAHLQFRTADWDKVQRYTSPGYKVKIGMGIDNIETENTYVVFKKAVTNFQGIYHWAVDVWLILDYMDFYNKHRLVVYNSQGDRKLSSEVVSTVANRVGLSPVVSQSSDKMMWMQHNISDRKFLEEVISHGWFGSDNPAMYCIRRDGTLIYKPISLLLTPKAVIGHAKEGVDIPVGQHSLTESDGFISSWLGKKRTYPYHDWEEGTDSSKVTSPTNHMSNFVGLDADQEKFAPIGVSNDNVHDKWLEAESLNLQGRGSLSAMTLDFELVDKYHDIYALDCYKGLFMNPDGGRLVTPFCGKWLVTKVLHKIADSHYSCIVTLAREGLMEDKSDTSVGGA